MGAAAAAVLAASAANAVVAPFGGASTGTDPLGQAWRVDGAAWGEPGPGYGWSTFNPSDLSNGAGDFATEFDFTFLKGAGSILENPQDTRFYDATAGVTWNADFVSNKEVDFTAPADVRLNAGDQFFVNVFFTSPVDAAKFSFAGLWSDLGGGSAVPGVPEPSTWAMMLLGLGLLGAAMRARRGRDAALSAPA